MDIREAQSRSEQLNAQLFLKRQEERRLKFEHQATEFEKKCIGYLPPLFKEEFEQRYFFTRFKNRKSLSKQLCHWRTAKKVILEVRLDPARWYDDNYKFYDWFYEKKMSLSYIQKILSLINLWGFFISRRLGTPFLTIPRPRGHERQRLRDAYFSKDGPSKYSDPLTPELLENAKDRLSAENYNWLFLSVWLGLRPKEIDQLKDKNFFKLLFDEKGTPIIWVQQTKIVSVPQRYRWKLIPLFLDQQKAALKILEAGTFKRPLTKTVRKRVDSKLTLYGGRKGFTDLMMAREQKLENISQWMGHSSIERTWISYKSKLMVHYRDAI